jgi:hypothetical protein
VLPSLPRPMGGYIHISMARSAGVEDQEVGERCAVGQGGSRGSRPDRWNPGQADPLLTPLLRGMEAHGSSKRCPGGEDDHKTSSPRAVADKKEDSENTFL